MKGRNVVASAPAKTILFGEHVVVLGRTALAAAINLRTYAVVSPAYFFVHNYIHPLLSPLSPIRADLEIALPTPSGEKLTWTISSLREAFRGKLFTSSSI